MSFDFGDIGSDFSNFFGNAATSVGNFFSGGSSDSTPTDSTSSTPANTSTPSTDSSSAFNLFSSTPSTGGATYTPTSGGSSGGSTPVSTLDLGTSLAGGTTPLAGGQSAVGGMSFTNPSDPTSSDTSQAQQTATSAGPTQSTMQSIMSSLGLGGASTGDLLKGLAGAGGLAYKATTGGSTSAEKAVKGEAVNAGAQGQQLESYLANGTLPPGAQQYVAAQTAAQKASISSKYAQLGMSGSTAEAQELANVDSQAQSQMFQIATQLYNTGVQQTGASANLYNTLMNAQTQDNAQIGSAISNFVSSLAPTATPTTKSS